jgi:ubiquinone/menaquinone biosynthesis C-methylase UbiE
MSVSSGTVHLDRPAWPLLPLAGWSSERRRVAREQALRAASNPDAIWEAFRGHRRRSSSAIRRAWARVDDAFGTSTPEYLDRTDISQSRREGIIEALDRTHRALGTYRWLCRLILPLVRNIERPRILEIASGHGQLSVALDRSLASRGISASIIGSDVAPELVALAQERARRAGSGVRFMRLDAAHLDLPDNSEDLAVNSLSMHHLPFGSMVKALSEMRRVARRAVVFDLWRAPLLFVPATLVMLVLSGSFDCTHDGAISLRKAWSTDAWYLAGELAGWESMSIGLVLPGFLWIRFDRESAPEDRA